MEQKTLSNWLKCILIGVGLCGLIVYVMVIPMMGMNICSQYPEFSNRFWPWLIFIWVSGIPCFMVLAISWRITLNIERNLSFSMANAELFKWISGLAAGDAGFFFVGNIVLFFLNMSHPSVVLGSLVIEFIGVAIAVASAVLSHLVQKAAVLQEQSDWTI